MVPHPCMFLLIPVAPPIWYLSIVAQIIIKCITWLTTYIIIMPMNGFMNNQYVYAWSDEISLCFSWFWLMIDWMVWRWFCSPRATQHIMHVLTEQTYEFLMAARVLYTRDLQMRASKMKQKLLSINYYFFFFYFYYIYIGWCWFGVREMSDEPHEIRI